MGNLRKILDNDGIQRCRAGTSALGLLSLFALLTLLLWPRASLAEDRAFGAALLDFMQVAPGELASAGEKPLVVEIKVSERSRQAVYMGLARLEDGAQSPFFLPGPGPVPSLMQPNQFGYFENPAQAQDLDSLELDEDDYSVLEECRPQKCRFKLSTIGIAEAEALNWKAPGARQAFLGGFRTSLADEVSGFQAKGFSALITYADKPTPYPVTTGIRRLLDEAKPVLDLYPRLSKTLADPEGPGESASGESDRVLWSVSDFGYRPTLSVDRLVYLDNAPPADQGSVMALQNLYSNHYLAGRLQLGGILPEGSLPGQSGRYFWTLDLILFDDALGTFKRSLLGRGLRSEVEGRLETIRSMGQP
ncbi:MAG: hypothetical protein P8Q97_17650 [Myxococcota bacterium]|jgi:hypothetical protein|nr:hypothetical protein [Myxococcota bacterium]